MNKKILFIPILALFLAFPALAAEVHFQSDSVAPKAGDEFLVSLYLNSQGQPINAVQGKVTFPADLLALKDITDGNSVVNFWVEKPKPSDNPVIFTGITPGGYGGDNGLLFTMRFVTRKVGQATVNLSAIQALLNDGQGTAAKVRATPLRLVVTKLAAGQQASQSPEITDQELPETFIPQIARDSALFDGQYFLTFATQDKGSGIDHYEVTEKRGFLRPTPDNWQSIDSPYLLKDQELQSWVFVKAIDKKGNQKIATVRPTNIPIYEQPIAILVLVILVAVAFFIVRKRKSGERV